MKLSEFAEIFIFFTLAPVVSVLEDCHIMQRYHKYDVIVQKHPL